MEKMYKYENAIVYVRSTDTYDRDKLKKATEDFLKKVMYGGATNGNTNPSKNF